MKFGNFFENFSFSTTFAPPRAGATAFFDSGIGGLSVLRACLLKGLDGEIVYFGDNARAPYGSKGVELIKRYTQEAFAQLEEYGVCRAIVACNTVTALCLEELNDRFPFSVYGTYPPVLSVRETDGDIFVFVTSATAKSSLFKNICTRARENMKSVKVYPLDGLVREIECNFLSPRGMDYVQYLPKGAPSAVVLGCTHYSFLKEEIADFYHCPVYDSSEETAARLQKKGVLGCSQRLDVSPNLNDAQEKVAQIDVAKKCSFPEKKVRISFVGSGKVVNKPICEQMFALK